MIKAPHLCELVEKELVLTHRCDALLLVYRGSNRGGAGRGSQGRDGRAS